MRGKASGQFPDEPQKFVVLGVVAVLVVIILLVVGAGAGGGDLQTMAAMPTRIP